MLFTGVLFLKFGYNPIVIIIINITSDLFKIFIKIKLCIEFSTMLSAMIDYTKKSCDSPCI